MSNSVIYNEQWLHQGNWHLYHLNFLLLSDTCIQNPLFYFEKPDALPLAVFTLLWHGNAKSYSFPLEHSMHPPTKLPHPILHLMFPVSGSHLFCPQLFWDQLFWILYMSEIMWLLFSCPLFASLRIMSSSSICVVTSHRISFLFMDDYSPPLCNYTAFSLTIHSSRNT